DVVLEIDAEMFRAAERRLTRWSAVAAGAFLAGADDGVNLAEAVHDAEGVTGAFEDIDIADAIGGHGSRIDERGCRCFGAIFGNALLAVASDGGDDAGLENDDANAAIIEIGQIKLLTFGVESGAIEAAEFGLRGRAAVAAE